MAASTHSTGTKNHISTATGMEEQDSTSKRDSAFAKESPPFFGGPSCCTQDAGSGHGSRVPRADRSPAPVPVTAGERRGPEDDLDLQPQLMRRLR